MRGLLKITILIFLPWVASAQPTDLIFTEYIEGASNDKCVEIYNGTGAPINIDNYSIRIYFNGNSAAGATIDLPNVVLNNCDVFVVCHSSAQAALLAIDDMSSGSLTFNGDDAVELFNGAAMVDLIGNIGCDPGTEWTGVGNGTADDIIRRQPSYCSSVSADPGASCPWPSFTAANWLSAMSTSDFSDLGMHTSSCASCVSNTITTGAISGSPFTVTCVAGSAVSVPFTSTGTFNAGNIYTAQLSDASGSFSFPVNIGTLSSTSNSGTINATIPAGTATGTGYRIRVISDNPIVTGTDNGVNLTINGIVQGSLIVNEASNGPSGTKEYTELLVTGIPCSLVSIQNFIIDDNNGDFGAGTGVASGHYRFTTDPQWGCIPTGSLIVIHNSGDINASVPADDETDANSDSIYVLPITSTYLEQCTSVPNSTPVTTYNGCTYVAGTTWNPLGMANSGDAAQVRRPDGTYEHGIGFGGATGGPDNILLAGGAGNNFYFANSVNDDPTSSANYATGTAPGNETPAAANNPANLAYILTFRCVPLPSELLDFTAIETNSTVNIRWTTASESGTEWFEVQRAGTNHHFVTIGSVSASGFSVTETNYRFTDSMPLKGISYYRLKEKDLDGRIRFSEIRSVYRHIQETSWIIYDHQVTLNGCPDGSLVELYDSGGKKVLSSSIHSSSFSIHELPAGLYLVRLFCNGQPVSFKFGLAK